MAFIAPLAIAFVESGAAAATAAAASVAAGVLTYAAAKSSAESESQAYKQGAALQSAIAARNASLVDIEGQAAADQLKRDRARALGADRAAMGALGYDISGSPLDVLADEHAQISRDLGFLGYNTAIARQNALLGGAVASRNQLLESVTAQSKQAAAVGGLFSGVFGALTPAYSAASKGFFG